MLEPVRHQQRPVERTQSAREHFWVPIWRRMGILQPDKMPDSGIEDVEYGMIGGQRKFSDVTFLGRRLVLQMDCGL